MIEHDRRRKIASGDTTEVKEGDVFFGRRKSETVVVVEVLDKRYARIVDQKNLDRDRLWRLTYLASSACDLQPHASPDSEVLKAWKEKTS